MIYPHRDRTREGYFSDLTLLGLALFAGIFMTACDRETKVDIATREKILLLGNSAEPKAIDPHLVSAVNDSNILRSMFEGLVAYHPESDVLHEPGVAERWEPNEDYSVWTFYLRENAKWSNGDPVTAHDFVYAYNRILHPKMAAPYASMLYFLKDAEKYNRGDIESFEQVGVHAASDHKLVCTLESPTPFFPDVVKHPTWLPLHQATIEKFGSMTDTFTDWQKAGNSVSNGPFVLTEWKINAYVKVRPNPHYWDAENVKLNGIDFIPIDSPFTEEKAFRNGLLHATYILPANLIPVYRERNDPALRMEPYNGVYFYRCNTDRTPTDNADFRRALAYAINREKIVEFITKGDQEPAYAFTPPAKGGYIPPNVLEHNPGKAKEYLRKAGYKSGKDVPEFTVIFNTLEDHKSIAVAIQDMWKTTLGIEKVRLENQEWKVYMQTVNDKRYDVSRLAWIGDYVDPTTFLGMWRTGDSNNRTGWSSSEYDRLFRESFFATEKEERYGILREAESIVLDELPILPIYWYTRVYLLHEDVENWHPLILDNRAYKHLDLKSKSGGKAQ